MKSTILAVLLALMVLLCISRTQAESCDDDKDCGPYECCTKPDRRKGRKKRAWGPMRDGTCTPFGGYGDTCFVNDGNSEFCQCGSLFKCEGLGILIIPQGEQGECKFN